MRDERRVSRGRSVWKYSEQGNAPAYRSIARSPWLCATPFPSRTSGLVVSGPSTRGPRAAGRRRGLSAARPLPPSAAPDFVPAPCCNAAPQSSSWRSTCSWRARCSASVCASGRSRGTRSVTQSVPSALPVRSDQRSARVEPDAGFAVHERVVRRSAVCLARRGPTIEDVPAEDAQKAAVPRGVSGSSTPTRDSEPPALFVHAGDQGLRRSSADVGGEEGQKSSNSRSGFQKQEDVVPGALRASVFVLGKGASSHDPGSDFRISLAVSGIAVKHFETANRPPLKGDSRARAVCTLPDILSSRPQVQRPLDRLVVEWSRSSPQSWRRFQPPHPASCWRIRTPPALHRTFRQSKLRPLPQWSLSLSAGI